MLRSRRLQQQAFVREAWLLTIYFENAALLLDRLPSYEQQPHIIDKCRVVSSGRIQTQDLDRVCSGQDAEGRCVIRVARAGGLECACRHTINENPQILT